MRVIIIAAAVVNKGLTMRDYKAKKITYEESSELIEYLAGRDDLILELNSKKKLIICYDSENKVIFDYKYPITFPVVAANDDLTSYAARISEVPQPYIVILIQAGNSALGYFEDGELVHHKVIKKYMVRKKQGKAQITHLKTRGKSRAGSRVRLANTVAFFEEINEKIIEWQKSESAHRILYSCPVRLWGLVFKSNVKTPFDRKDPRLRRIPLDVHIPNFEELGRVNRFALSGFITFYQTDHELENVLLK